MRRLVLGIGTVGCVIGSLAPAASARALGGTAEPPAGFPTGCRTTSYTADGGYFSQGQFFWEPSDTVTLTTRWCFAHGVVTSDAVSWSTTIPQRLVPQVSTAASLAKGGAILDVQLNGTYDSGVVNNVGSVTIIGYVTRRGGHHFTNATGAGG